KTAILYPPGEEFPVGKCRLVKSSDKDRVAVVAAGITVHEGLKAVATLEQQGVAVRLIDAYSVKPIDRAALHEAARVTGGRFVVVEDHWAEGGLGAAVLDAFTGAGEKPPVVVKLAVGKMPGSGTPAEMLEAAGISAAHIVKAVQSLV